MKPTAAEAAPLLRDLSERVLHLFALYNGIRLAAGAGSTLAQDLSRRAAAVMTAVKVTTHGTIIEAQMRDRHDAMNAGAASITESVLHVCCSPWPQCFSACNQTHAESGHLCELPPRCVTAGRRKVYMMCCAGTARQRCGGG